MKPNQTPKTIDEYIAVQPAEVQPLLQAIRRTIHEAAPDAQETISYQMPAFKQDKNTDLVRRLQKPHKHIPQSKSH